MPRAPEPRAHQCAAVTATALPTMEAVHRDCFPPKRCDISSTAAYGPEAASTSLRPSGPSTRRWRWARGRRSEEEEEEERDPRASSEREGAAVRAYGR